MRPATIIVVVLAWPAAAQARDDGYTIAFRGEQAGDKTEVSRVGTETVKYVLSVAGREKSREAKKGTKAVYTQEVVARPAGAKRPTKLVRAYRTAERTADGKTEKLPYDGKTVTIEKKGARYTFAVGGDALAAADAEELEKEFNKQSDDPIRNEDFVPKGPARVNDVWVVDPGPVVKSFEAHTPLKLDRERTKVTGKLTKVYEKGGARYGVIELTLTLAAKGLTQGDQELPLKPGSAVTARIEIDGCIDGSSADAADGVRMTLDLRPVVPDGSLTITTETTRRGSVKQVGKK